MNILYFISLAYFQVSLSLLVFLSPSILSFLNFSLSLSHSLFLPLSLGTPQGFSPPYLAGLQIQNENSRGRELQANSAFTLPQYSTHLVSWLVGGKRKKLNWKFKFLAHKKERKKISFFFVMNLTFSLGCVSSLMLRG